MKSENELRAKIESNEGRAEWGAWAIVVGLVVEVVLAIAFPGHRGWIEDWGPVFATALIALGVYIEIHFGRRAASAHKDLQSSTEKKLTEALDRATKTETTLIKLLTPRRTLMRAAGVALWMVDQLKPFAGTDFDIGSGEGDGEQADFVWDLEQTLRASGWRQIHWGVHGVGITAIVRPNQPVLGSVAAQNVEVHLDPAGRTEMLPAAEALISALREVGIDARETIFNVHSTNTRAIHVLVGPKR